MNRDNDPHRSTGGRPHRSKRRGAVRIEVLYFDGCPNHEQLLGHLPGLLEREGVEAEISLVNVADDERAQRERFLGSPTIRVDGRDIDPGGATREDYGLKCRIYQTAAGLTGLPPDEWILEALADSQEDRR